MAPCSCGLIRRDTRGRWQGPLLSGTIFRRSLSRTRQVVLSWYETLFIRCLSWCIIRGRCLVSCGLVVWVILLAFLRGGSDLTIHSSLATKLITLRRGTSILTRLTRCLFRNRWVVRRWASLLGRAPRCLPRIIASLGFILRRWCFTPTLQRRVRLVGLGRRYMVLILGLRRIQR